MAKRLVVAIAMVSCLWLMLTPGAIAGLNDDNFDGNIYALYGGNGSLVPPRVSLEQSLSRDDRATVLVFFLDDSSDCKEYTAVVSQIQAFYGRAADILPLNVDAIPVKDEYAPTEPGYYYSGVIPQTVVLDLEGKVVYDGKGQVSYESIDDVLRQVYDLLPRSESIDLKRRAPNEVSVELSR
ncbi:MAG: thylakoid membrane photosystem I accumulation factor [Chroococcales cyanobacterium]